MSAGMRQPADLSASSTKKRQFDETDIREALRPLAQLIAQQIAAKNLTERQETASLDDIDGAGDAGCE